MPDFELYLLRHGQTDWNLRGALQGRLDTPLNATGLQQAQEVAEKIKAQSLHFDAVYTSPLRRAKDTARIATGLAADQIIIDNRLVEFSFGAWEGRSGAELAADIKGFFDPQEDFCAPGGENFPELFSRTKTFLRDIGKLHRNQRVLVVSHAAALHAMLTVFAQRPLAQFWKVTLGNCGLVKLTNAYPEGEVLFQGFLNQR